MNAAATGTDNDDVHIQAQVAVLQERTGALKGTVDRHEGQMNGIYGRLGRIERLIYVGIGGVIILGGIVSIVGGKILRLLA